MRNRHYRNNRDNRNRDNSDNRGNKDNRDNERKQFNQPNNPPKNLNDKIKFVSTNVTKDQQENNNNSRKKKYNNQFFNIFGQNKKDNPNKNIRNNRDNRDNRDNRGNRDNRDNRDNRGNRDNRDNRDNRGNRDNRDNRDNRGNRDNRDNRDNRGNRDNRDFNKNRTNQQKINSIKNNPNKIFNEQKKIQPTTRTKRIVIYKVNEFSQENCTICDKKITDMSTSIKDENDKFYHFDCLMKDLELKNKDIMKPAQRIAYLGSNTFGIIEDFKENGKNKFKIAEKISYSNKPAI